jgi:hypothetical protein
VESMKGKTSLSHVWSVIRSLNGKRLPPMARNTVLEHGGRIFVSDTAKADVFIKHYASVSRHKFSRAERRVDRDVHVRLTEDSSTLNHWVRRVMTFRWKSWFLS